MPQCQFNIDPGQLLSVVEEVESRIRQDGISRQEKAKLYYQLGALYELMGDSVQQKFAWARAEELDSGIKIFEASL